MKVMKIVDINGIVRDCDHTAPDEKFPGYLRVDFISKRNPEARISEWFPIEDFKRLNPEHAKLASKAPAKETLGIVTKSTLDTLKDTKQAWKPDAYVGFTVWISRGLGEGQTRVVLHNSKNTLTLDKPWEVKPDRTSQYVVSLHVQNSEPLGNTLPIVPEVTEKK